MAQSDTLIGIDFTEDDDTPWWEVALRIMPITGLGYAVHDFVKYAEKQASSGGGSTAMDHYSKEAYPEVLYLPFYTLSAEEIFKGNIAMFDVDFFNPKNVYVKTKALSGQADNYQLTEEGRKFKAQEYPNMSEHDAIFHILNRYDLNNQVTSSEGNQKEINEKLKISQQDKDKYLKLTKHTKLSEVTNKNNIDYYYYIDDNGKEIRTSSDNTASALSEVISKWYKALRNIAIVLMMSILLYIGIRILLSTVSSDKAKYKQMLMDWLVGICLLFVMHYIMAFSVTLVNKFVTVINTIDKGQHVVFLENDDKDKLANGIKKVGIGGDLKKEGNMLAWPTNLMGRMRIAAEMNHGKVSFIGYAICFVVLVFYTIFFAFTYLKRVIYLAFLTIIAPFVAMTYPIDKVNDGQAQGFNKWLKEYIFNLLIQPLHLLLYTMLVSSVFDFASQNVWYMLVAIGFLIPAEKLLRSLFGFEKASTPGSLASAAVGAGLISNGVGKLLHKMPGDSHSKSRGNNRDLDDGNNNRSPRTNFDEDDFDATGSLMAGMGLIEGSQARENEVKDESTREDKEQQEALDRYKQEQLNKQQQEALDKYRQEGFKKNANGEYFNPYTNEYDAKYNPLEDKNYNDVIKNLGNTTTPQQKLLNNRMNQVPRRSRKISKNRSIRRALKAGARRTFTGKNVSRAIRAVGGKGIRMAAGATLGLAAGTIGVAAGIASGDPSKAFQYGATGLGAGAMAGSKFAGGAINTAQSVEDSIKNSETRRAMTEAYYGEDYKEKQQAKQIKEWKKNIEYKEALERTIGENQAKEMYKSGEIDEYLKHGIDDVSDMAAMHQLQEDKIANGIEEAVAIHEYGERIGGDYTRLREKDKREWGETFSNEFQGQGISKEQSENASQATFDKIKEYHTRRKNMKRRL